ncbi:conserved hypothetical protein [Mesorhizobium plurifarium]|uniref:Glycosyltransferase n=1 Tax=Mesorhizobium plurifarium TaxID=69974 RepID=A0A090G6R0_MESPL|nr:conserved hypothetical protein [Mesorhizobium plurifarium]
MTRHSIWIGWDPREAAAFAAAKASIERRLISPIQVRGLVQSNLRAAGLYYRPTSVRDGRIWDDISDAPCSTEFSNSRFLVPHLAKTGLALFVDCDVLARANVETLFNRFDTDKAVMVVKHNFAPPEGLKMDGQVQTQYARKNWSSCMIFNVDHPANKALTVEMVNTLPGRDLHAFCWLEDGLIGELDASWNYLVGHTNPEIDPDIVHFTDGIPTMPGYENCEYADEWRAELERWAAGAVAVA